MLPEVCSYIYCSWNGSRYKNGIQLHERTDPAIYNAFVNLNSRGWSVVYDRDMNG